MSDLPNSFDASDWELSDDFYTENAEQKELRLEDFMIPEEEHSSSPTDFEDPELAKIVSDVQRVLDIYSQGLDIAGIAEKLCLDTEYIHTILYCAQGFAEDDPIAVARLVMMS